MSGGTILLNHGPITMTLEAYRGGEPYPIAAESGAAAVIDAFDDFVSSGWLGEARKFIRFIDRSQRDAFPGLMTAMWNAVAALEEEDFTPMAAVAGTFSDLAVEAMAEAGADYAVANNGGDIAYLLPADRDAFRVGIMSDLRRNEVTHILVLSGESRRGGIATSGFGGRSLTRGVASAVTAIAGSASAADAAATSIANACDCCDPAIARCLACELDAMTDIAGLRVTKAIGALCKDSVHRALDNGAKRAEALCAKGIVTGAILFVSGEMAARGTDGTPSFEIETCVKA